MRLSYLAIITESGSLLVIIRINIGRLVTFHARLGGVRHSATNCDTLLADVISLAQLTNYVKKCI